MRNEAMLDECIAALDAARDRVALHQNGRILTAPETVREALAEAVATIHRLPNRSAGWLYSQSAWPQIVHDHQDQIDNYKEMMRRIVSGEESSSALVGKQRPTSAAIQRMEAIFEVFPACLVGKTRCRDWETLLLLAAGHTVRAVARQTATSVGTVVSRRELQVEAIANKLIDLMPPTRTEAA